MKNRWFAILLLLILALAVLSLLSLYSTERDSVTLAELVLLDEKNNAPARAEIDSVASAGVDNVFLANLEIASIFYAVLGVCGFLIAIRIVVSVLRALKEERLHVAHQPYESRGPVSGPGRSSNELTAAANPSSPETTPGFNEVMAEERRMGRTQRAVSRFAPSRVWDYLGHYAHGLTGRMVLTFTGLVAMFGLLTMALVYFTLASSLSKHVIERARITAVNISDGAPGFLFKNNAAGLRELLRKHASRPELAYILVENRAGEILAHSFSVLPKEVQAGSLPGDRSAGSRRLNVGENAVEEVFVPILEGRGGAVRVGMWREHIDAEINETVIPLIKLLGFVVSGGVLLALFLAWRINRPIFRLVAAAKAISTGDLDVQSPRVDDTSEFGELARAIERMRSSVKAAMIRLERFR